MEGGGAEHSRLVLVCFTAVIGVNVGERITPAVKRQQLALGERRHGSGIEDDKRAALATDGRSVHAVLGEDSRTSWDVDVEVGTPIAVFGGRLVVAVEGAGVGVECHDTAAVEGIRHRVEITCG
jgi:hypothetical protein